MDNITKLVDTFKEQGLLLPIWYEDGAIKVLDQIKLPFVEEVYTFTDVRQVADSIRTMVLRGSGAVGCAGAYGMLLAAIQYRGGKQDIFEAAGLLKSTRPTAVNLMKTVDEVVQAVKDAPEDGIADAVELAVCNILSRYLAYEHALGEYGADLIQDGDNILTHCHSGALAGSGYGGRALSVIRKAHEQGKKIHVYSSETRPYLQGARITVYELQKFGIAHTLITDGMSGYLMQLGKIQKAVVGSDRVAANGDLLNKVGTYMHAVAARENGVPFYTATSSHTIDLSLARGLDIEVEYRGEQEVLSIAGHRIAPEGIRALYPLFDVTPCRLISGIITERGIVRAPYTENIKALFSK